MPNHMPDTILLIIMLIGAILWFATITRPSGGKINELGKILFFCALLAICFGQHPFGSLYVTATHR